MRAQARSLVLSIAFAAGCTAEDAVPDDDMLVFETGEFEVGAGDVFECFYTDVIVDRDLAATGAFGTQVGSGGHHITIYYTTSARPPGHHPCEEEEMITWQQVGGAGSEAASALRLPDGLAIAIPAGAQMVLQAHYINTTGERYTTNETAGIYLVDPATVVDYVRQFVVLDTAFRVPPHESLEKSGSCTVSRDVPLVKLLGHMHEWGVRYQLEEVDASGETIRSLIDDDVDAAYASHPPIASFGMNDPLLLRAGTRLRQTCRWNNFEDDELVFPREMCVAFGLYFGGDEDIYCNAE